MENNEKMKIYGVKFGKITTPHYINVGILCTKETITEIENALGVLMEHGIVDTYEITNACTIN